MGSLGENRQSSRPSATTHSRPRRGTIPFASSRTEYLLPRAAADPARRRSSRPAEAPPVYYLINNVASPSEHQAPALAEAKRKGGEENPERPRTTVTTSGRFPKVLHGGFRRPASPNLPVTHSEGVSQ